jgi:parallel beta-helix repeat protein
VKEKLITISIIEILLLSSLVTFMVSGLELSVGNTIDPDDAYPGYESKEPLYMPTPLTSSSTEVKTVYVDDDYDESTPGWGYDHFDKIQEGIDAVDENGIVNICNGIYFENIIVDKSVTIIGEDKDKTIIDGGGSDVDVVYIRANDVGFSNLGVRNGYHGIWVKSSGCEIDNCDVYSNSDDGIIIREGGYVTVTNSRCHHNADNGLKIDNCDYNIVEDCTLDNNDHSGILIYDPANYNTIKSCNVKQNGRGIFCYRQSIETTIEKCTITNNNKPCGDWPSCPWTYKCGMVLYGHDNMTIKDCKSNSNPGKGVDGRVENSKFINCEFSYNLGTGVYILWSQDNEYIDCDFNNNGEHGVFFDCGDSSMIDCDIKENEKHGIRIDGNARDFTVTNCTISNNKENGINVCEVIDDLIVNNCTISNNDKGIYCGSFALITYCTFEKNSYGLYINKERYSISSRIHHNNFIGNDIQAFDHHTSSNGDKDKWSDGGIGNYWSDYTGVDEDPEDGIGDTPYDILDCGHQDKFPLMKPIGKPKCKSQTYPSLLRILDLFPQKIFLILRTLLNL